MIKRALSRIPSNIKVEFCCCASDNYSGITTNMSEKGMFISTEMCFPLDSKLNILMEWNKNVINIPVIIRWLRKFEGLYNGIGVEIMDAPLKYLELVARLRQSE
jgi:hypothetical protein